MTSLRDLVDRLPLDHPALRAVPVPGLRGRCLVEIDLARGIAESAPDSPVQAVRSRHVPVLRALVEGLRRAAGDDRVVGLVAHVGGAHLTLAQAEEIRAAVRAFRAANKPTLAWAETFGELGSGVVGYLAASAFEEIWLQPSGDLGLVGVATEALFLRGALDKLGVQPQFAQRHEYKSAADTFMATSMTPPHREMLQRILDSVVEAVSDTIAEARGLTTERVRELIDLAPLRPQDARDAGLIDRIGYRDEAFASIRERIGESEESLDVRFVERYRKTLPTPSVRRSRPVVAIVGVHGGIHLGRSGGGSPLGARSAGSDTVGAALRQARRDERVSAVVLRVDSPGGSYVASDAIRREVLAVQEQQMPVIASMGSVAASGGYFVAMPCTEIVANATTLTGSIGVVAGKGVLAEGLARVGINRELLTWGRYAGMFSTQRPFDEQEWQRLDTWLDTVYADFTAKAALDRSMPLERLEPLARGRVWTGADALDRGLVDRIGGLEVAVERACAALGVDRDKAEVRVVPKLGPLDRFVAPDNSDTPVSAGLGEGIPLLERALAGLGLAGHGVLSMPPLRMS